MVTCNRGSKIHHDKLVTLILYTVVLNYFIIQEAFKSIQKQILKVSVTRESSTSEKQCNLFANFEPFV